MRGRERLRNAPWSGLSLTILGSVVLVMAWTTQRGQVGSFPESLLSAVGLLLTALVFVLALAQSRLQRTADAAAVEARQLDEVVVAAHVEHPDAVTTMDLWARAGAMQAALFSGTDTGWSRWERQQVLREARRPVSNWGVAGSFERALEIHAIDTELGRASDDAKYPSPRRRKHLVRERKRIVREDKEAQDAAERAGITVNGYRRVLGRVRVAEVWVRYLVSLARVFSVLMLGLVILGVIYAGWEVDRVPSPDVWAAVVLIALALVYSRVVLDDVDLEMASLHSALRDSSLLGLYAAEWTLGKYWQVVEDRERTGRGPLDLRRMIEKQLEQVAQRTPGLPWLASVNGRVLLIRAIDCASRIYEYSGSEARNERTRQELLEALRPATRLLRYAAAREDDPSAALAYGRLLALQAEILQDALVHGIPDFFLSDDLSELHVQARRHIDRALELMRDLPIVDRDLSGLPHRDWIKNQSYLWPEDEALRRELRRTLLIEQRT